MGRKLSQWWLGPFTVTDRLGPTAYWLDLPPTYRFHPVFHVSLLRAFDTSGAHRGDQHTPIIIQQSEQVEHEVEKLLRHREVGRPKKLQFLVMWKGHDLASATWEPEGNLEHAEERIAEYWKGQRRVSLALA